MTSADLRRAAQRMAGAANFVGIRMDSSNLLKLAPNIANQWFVDLQTSAVCARSNALTLPTAGAGLVCHAQGGSGS
jgi:hypothetical protein